MEDGRNLSRSGGCLLAFSVVAGTVVGTIMGQPSIGFLAGSALGLVLVLAVFVLDRR
jgi:mannose/fructose/N-acetylgalactosamine-specific phosphotransferase system component IIC